MLHCRSIFNNSCLKVPVDPVTKMPTPAYERKGRRRDRGNKKRLSIDSVSTEYSLKTESTTKQVRDFYKSIPDYKELNHLNQEEFYSTLRGLREKKRQMLGFDEKHFDEDAELLTGMRHLSISSENNAHTNIPREFLSRDEDQALETKGVTEDHKLPDTIVEYSSNLKKIADEIESVLADVPVESTECLKMGPIKDSRMKTSLNIENSKEATRLESRNRRNHSACSISWNDQQGGNDVDRRFAIYFSGVQVRRDKERISRSVPNSPVKVRGTLSPGHRRVSTVPKPFNMTLRDDDSRTCSSLKRLSKSFSEEMLNRKCSRRFRARPVPIESRIPLYDKIMEDQAMRRAISKINSTAELQAQMKPFSFTKREDRMTRQTPVRYAESVPSTMNKFKARPPPKNLLSEYFRRKVKEEEFYRSLNRRIRAEELLRKSSLPPSMAARDKTNRSRMSTPGGLLSDLPTDTMSERSSNKSGKRRRKRSSAKKRETMFAKEFITTSPQPFRFATSSRVRPNTQEEVQTIYSKPQRTLRASPCTTRSDPRPVSALDIPNVNRSNLAALLRIESTKKRLEEEVEKQMAEQELKAEQKWRDHVLRKKPAWKLVKNNYEEDIAMRLQTRRDEERLRREEFLHQMELMYGRVRNQPLLFERYYASKFPNSVTPASSQEVLGRERMKQKNTRTSSRSRKVSINEDADKRTDLSGYLDPIVNEDKLYSATDSLSDISTKSTKNQRT